MEPHCFTDQWRLRDYLPLPSPPPLLFSLFLFFFGLSAISAFEIKKGKKGRGLWPTGLSTTMV